MKRKCGAKMFLSEPSHPNFYKFVMRDGTASFQNDSGMYAWSRTIPRLARYEPNHPLKIKTKEYNIMEAFEDEVLPNEYRREIEEFQGETPEDFAETVAVQQTVSRELGQTEQSGDPVIQARLRELERTIPDNTPNRDELIQELISDFIKQRLRGKASVNKPNQGVQSGRQEVERQMQRKPKERKPKERKPETPQELEDFFRTTQKTDKQILTYLTKGKIVNYAKSLGIIEDDVRLRDFDERGMFDLIQRVSEVVNLIGDDDAAEDEGEGAEELKPRQRQQRLEESLSVTRPSRQQRGDQERLEAQDIAREVVDESISRVRNIFK